MTGIFKDWKANNGNLKGKIILLSFRIAHIATSNKILFAIWIPYLIFYRVWVEWILGCEIPYKTNIGEGTNLFHGQALIINDGTSIGNNCTLRQSTSIGHKKLKDGTYSRCPTIGNNVDIGCNVCIIGAINIGDNSVIGAGSLVSKMSLLIASSQEIQPN